MLSQNSLYLSEQFNNSSMLRRFFWCFCIAFFLFSCTDEKAASSPLVSFERRSLLKGAEKDCDSLAQDCSSISLKYLSAVGTEERVRNINTSLFLHLRRLVLPEEPGMETDYDKLARQFLAQAEKATGEFPGEAPWRVTIEEKLYFRQEGLISIGIEAFVFTGGAHGYSSLSFLNFDPATGDLLSPEDIFLSGFTELAETYFRQKWDIPLKGNINSTGFRFENDRFRLPSNLGFDSENVVLVYDASRIGPKPSGQITVEIPRQQAWPFLKLDL